MRKKWTMALRIFIAGIMLTAASLPFIVFAQSNGSAEEEDLPSTPAAQIKESTKQFFGESGYQVTETPGEGVVPLALRIGVLTNTVLLLVGIVFLVLVVYSGIQWMTAGGNEERVTRARQRIVHATLGLIIVVGAWVLTTFVLNAVFGPVRPPGPAIRLFRRF